LGLDADFDTAEAGEEEIHFVAEASGGAHVFAGGVLGFDFAVAILEEAPSLRELFPSNQTGGGEVKAFAAQGDLRIVAEGFAAVGEEIGAGDFAFDDYGVAGFFPSDGVGHFSAGAGLLGEDYPAAVGAEPFDGLIDELAVGHGVVVTSAGIGGKVTGWLHGVQSKNGDVVLQLLPDAVCDRGWMPRFVVGAAAEVAAA
jgi:hypothetical protein